MHNETMEGVVKTQYGFDIKLSNKGLNRAMNGDIVVAKVDWNSVKLMRQKVML